MYEDDQYQHNLKFLDEHYEQDLREREARMSDTRSLFQEYRK